jgi:hypothetical protein
MKFLVSDINLRYCNTNREYKYKYCTEIQRHAMDFLHDCLWGHYMSV